MYSKVVILACCKAVRLACGNVVVLCGKAVMLAYDKGVVCVLKL